MSVRFPSFLTLVFCGGVTLSPIFQCARAQMDSEVERKIFNEFQSYETHRSSLDIKTAIGKKRSSESYIVQPSDTMWDLSHTFFGDSYFWPQIWSSNGEIPNPHLIEPGAKLLFFPGGEEAPPQMLVEGKRTSQPPPTPVRPAPHVNLGQVEIPPPSIIYPRVLHNLPPSLPQWQGMNKTQRNYDESGVSIDLIPVRQEEIFVPVPSYITEKYPISVGTVKEIETSYKIAAPMQSLYLQLKSSFEVGEQLSVVRDGGPVNERLRAVIVESVGVVTLTELVDQHRKIYRATLDASIRPLMLGDKVIEEPLQEYSINMQGTRNSIYSVIVGGSYEVERRNLGNEDFVYLNRGSNHGLSVGQVLTVIENRKLRYPDTIIFDGIREIGQIQIVSVTPKFSTALIVESLDSIGTGDFTGVKERSMIRTSLDGMDL